MALYAEFLDRFRWQAGQVSDVTPWRMLAAPGVILQKQAHALQRTYLVRGQDLTADTWEAQGAKMLQANNVLKRLGGTWMLQSEAQRTRLTTYPPTRADFPVAALIDQDRRHVMLEQPGARETTYYLTLTWQPPALATQRAARLMVTGLPASDVQEEDETAQLPTFVTQADALMDLLSSVLAVCRPLTTNELLTYLHTQVSNRWHAVRCPGNVLDIDTQLCDTPYWGGWYPVLGDLPDDPTAWHLRTCSITGYPAQVLSGLRGHSNAWIWTIAGVRGGSGWRRPRNGPCYARCRGPGCITNAR